MPWAASRAARWAAMSLRPRPLDGEYIGLPRRLVLLFRCFERGLRVIALLSGARTGLEEKLCAAVIGLIVLDTSR